MEKTFKKFMQISAILLLVIAIAVVSYVFYNNITAEKTNTVQINQETTETTSATQTSEQQAFSSVVRLKNNTDDTSKTNSSSSMSVESVDGDSVFGMDFIDFDSSKLKTQVVDFTVVIAFVNLSGYSETWSQSDIDTIMYAMNDKDPTNEILSVYEYFYEQTYGKLRFHAYYVKSNSSVAYSDVANRSLNDGHAYELEEDLYYEAIGNSTELKDENGIVSGTILPDSYYCRFLYYPGKTDGWYNILWPHAWSGAGLISTPYEIITSSNTTYTSPFIGTYAHELSHIMGLKDLYTYSGTEKPVGSWCLMGTTNKYYPTGLNAYYKSLLGVLSSDGSTSAQIGEIQTSGEYKLAPSNSQSGTVAYKFGEREIEVSGICNYTSCKQHNNSNNKNYTEKGKEMFFIEYKKQSSSTNATDYALPDSGILIYRVVESKHALMWGNAYPEMLGDVKYQISVLRKNNDNTRFLSQSALHQGETAGSTDGKQSSTMQIAYHDGENVKIAITHNGYDANGNASISVKFAEEPDTFTISGTFNCNSKAVAGASVLIQIPNQDGSYSAEIDTGAKTSSIGRFYVTGLPNGTRFRLYKDEKICSQYYTIENSDILNKLVSIRQMNLTTPRISGQVVSIG